MQLNFSFFFREPANDTLPWSGYLPQGGRLIDEL